MDYKDLLGWCGLNIRVLPDFLQDHTLLPDQLEGRMREISVRWIHLLRRLWMWQGTTFCLRFISGEPKGTITLFFLAKPGSPADREAIQTDLEQIVQAFGIVPNISDMRLCLPLLTPDGFNRRGISGVEIENLTKQMVKTFSAAIGFAPLGPFAVVTQEVDKNLWWDHVALKELKEEIQSEFKEGANIGEVSVENLCSYLPRLWLSPGDAFLLPVRALVVAKNPICLSIYVQPTQLTMIERRWLEGLRRKASESLESINFRDIGTRFFAEIASDTFNRLSPHPFMVAGEVASMGNCVEDVNAMAATLQAVAMGDAGMHGGNFPETGAFLTRVSKGESLFDSAVNSHMGVEFPRWADNLDLPFSLRRFNYLGDARSAATFFRLPVSVNGGIAGLEVRQRLPDFYPGPRELTAPIDHLDLGRMEDGGLATMNHHDLTKHGLITGFTGSGKTVTVLSILSQVWKFKKPFLVFESAKQEYRGFFGVPDFCSSLRVYTLGNETAVPFRFNPFELLPGVRVEAHIGRLQICFEGAVAPVGPVSSVFAEALQLVYAKQGWMITDTCPKDPQREFPTLGGFVEVVKEVIKARNYSPEVNSNLTAAIVGRLQPLLIGSKGRMLNCQNSIPTPDELFSKPTILEMNDLNLDDKAILVMFLLVLLREYREIYFRTHPESVGLLSHVTVVEEAHNVLAKAKSSGNSEGAAADTKFKAVEAFCTLLTEIRSLGEGLLIVDQSPEKLAADAIKNTNLQIAHQLRDGHDRDEIANAMIMTREQRDYIGKLRPGQAALFRTGLERATFVSIPIPDFYPKDDEIVPGKFIRNMDDDSLLKIMDELEQNVQKLRNPVRPFSSCAFCPVKVTCPYGDIMWSRVKTNDSAISDFIEWKRLHKDKSTNDILNGFLVKVSHRVALEMEENGIKNPKDSNGIGIAWCYMIHLWHKRFSVNSPGKIAYGKFITLLNEQKTS